MTSAFTKADNEDLMERYTLTCYSCGHLRQVFGTAAEVHARAITMGWAFKMRQDGWTVAEDAYCQHCKAFLERMRAE